MKMDIYNQNKTFIHLRNLEFVFILPASAKKLRFWHAKAYLMASCRIELLKKCVLLMDCTSQNQNFFMLKFRLSRYR